MFAESSKNAEHSVHSTGVPLSERFKNIPSHNPFRPNPCPNSSTILCNNETKNQNRLLGNTGFCGRKSFGNNGSNAMKFGGGLSRPMKSSASLPLLHRLGIKSGSGSFGRKGYNGVQRQGGLSNKVLRDPLGLQRSGFIRAKGSTKINFFGTPKSKEALDDELDKYMSQTKSKKKTDLDQELDEYMKHANKVQSLAFKVDVTPATEPSTPPAVEEPEEDTEMEVVESL